MSEILSGESKSRKFTEILANCFKKYYNFLERRE
jgi:hypothetical protein